MVASLYEDWMLVDESFDKGRKQLRGRLNQAALLETKPQIAERFRSRPEVEDDGVHADAIPGIREAPVG